MCVASCVSHPISATLSPVQQKIFFSISSYGMVPCTMMVGMVPYNEECSLGTLILLDQVRLS